jgi:hypothetical protein
LMYCFYCLVRMISVREHSNAYIFLWICLIGRDRVSLLCAVSVL